MGWIYIMRECEFAGRKVRMPMTVNSFDAPPGRAYEDGYAVGYDDGSTGCSCGRHNLCGPSGLGGAYDRYYADGYYCGFEFGRRDYWNRCARRWEEECSRAAAR